MIIKDPQNGSEYALRKHASDLIGEDEILFDKLDERGDGFPDPHDERGGLDPMGGLRGSISGGRLQFRQRVLKSLMEEFRSKRNSIMEEERNRTNKEQEAQRDRMKELLMRLFEGKDPAQALTKDDREQFERMADLQALQSALAEFEAKWSVIMN